MKTAPDQCIICRRRSPRGLGPGARFAARLAPLVDSEGGKASIHTYHHFDTIFRAGFTIEIQPLSDPVPPGAWSLK